MTIRVSLLWASVVLFIAIEAVLLYFFHHADANSKQTIAYGGSIVAGAFAIFSYLKGVEHSRRQAAERLIARWTDPDMTPMKDIVREITEGQMDASTLMRTGKGARLDKEALAARSRVVGMLNFYEQVAIAVNTKSADEGTLKKFFRSVICQAFDNLENWIRNERTIDNEPRYYIQLEAVVKRWKGGDD